VRTLYHYFAEIPNGYGRSILIDGLLNLSSPILNMDDYRKCKEAILDAQTLKHLPVSDLTIKSLAVLQSLEDH